MSWILTSTRERGSHELKILKISAVVTIALTVGWWLRIPHRMMPEHPMLADLLIGIALCALLQFLWVETKVSEKK